MEAEILFDISHLKFDDKYTAKVNDGLFNLTNIDAKRSDFFTDIYIKQYGLNATLYVPDSVFAYSNLMLNQADKTLLEEIQMQFEEAMFERQQFVETLLTFFWFVKDNSIGLYSTIGIIPATRQAHRVSKSLSYWTCTGEKKDVIFTPNEISEAASLTIQYGKICNRTTRKRNELILGNYQLDHGQPFKSNKDIETTGLLEKAKKIDSILRRVFKKAISEDAAVFTEYTNEERDAYLNSLVFNLPFERKTINRHKKD